jgi:hypothetical protein
MIPFVLLKLIHGLQTPVLSGFGSSSHDARTAPVFVNLRGRDEGIYAHKGTAELYFAN